MSATALALENFERQVGGPVALLGDRVLLTTPPIHDRYGSLWIPPEGEWYEQQLQGDIVAVGPLVNPLLAPGCRVLTTRFGQVHLAADTPLWVTTEDFIIAVVLDDEAEPT